jgi:hypothetical protein
MKNEIFWIERHWEPSVTFNITKTKKIEALMTTLAKLYEKPSALNKVFLMKCLFNLKMIEGGFVTNHLNEFNTITSQLTFINVNFDEEVRLSWSCVLSQKI